MFKTVQKKFYSKTGAVLLSTVLLIVGIAAACTIPAAKNERQSGGAKTLTRTQNELFAILEKTPEATERRFSIINQITANYRKENKNDDLILFLTDYVKKYPNDKYNAYWLLLSAYIYQEKGAEPIAEMYFERIIKNYNDLSIQGKSSY